MYEPPNRHLSQLAFLWPALAAASASEFATAMAKQWMDLTAAPEEKFTVTWTTPNTIALELQAVRLRDFSTAANGFPTLLCTPFALHTSTVADFAPSHSLVAALQASGLQRLFATDWCSATPEMRFLSIDDYLATLNVLVDEVGGSVDLIGLCQGGWLALLYASRFPGKARKLVIAGAPIDIAAAPSTLSTIVDTNPLAVFQELVKLGGGRVLGQKVLQFWNPAALPNSDIHRLLQTPLAPDSTAFVALAAAYRRWYDATVDLPGTYYLEVVDRLYRQNALARGCFVALGHTIDLARLDIPLYLLAARDDELVAPQQLFAAEHLVGTSADHIIKSVAPCRHLSLFMGKDVLGEYWPAITRWLGDTSLCDAGTRTAAAH